MKAWSMIPAALCSGGVAALAWIQTHEISAVVTAVSAVAAGVLWLLRVVWRASGERQGMADSLTAIGIRVDTLVVQVERQTTATNKMSIDVAALCHTCRERTRLYDAMARGAIADDENP